MNDIAPDVIYRQTENALIKEIEDELIITILKNEGFQSSDNLIYTTNKTGSVIWKRIDGQTKLKDLIKTLSEEYNASADIIEKDVTAIVKDFLQKNLIYPI